MKMPTRSSRIALFVLTVTIGALSAAAHADAVRIGFSERVAAWPLLIAQQRGYFDKQGVDVSLVPMDSVQAPFDLFDDDAVDLVTMTADQLLVAEQYGYELNGVLLLAESAGADIIVTTDTIRSAGRLRGKRVSFEAASAGELLLREALQRRGLSLDDIEPVPLYTVSSDAEQDDDSALVDAQVMQAPWTEDQRPAHLGHTLYSSSRTSGLVTDTLAGNERWIDDNKEIVKKIIRAWDDAVAWQARSSAAAAGIVADATGLEVEDARRWMDSVRMLGTSENVQAFRGDYQKAFMAMSDVMQPVLGSERGLPSANDYFSLAALRQVAAGR